MLHEYKCQYLIIYLLFFFFVIPSCLADSMPNFPYLFLALLLLSIIIIFLLNLL
ncbi:hypothetical protein F4703DRAFT_1881593 [Phycomyces blakesleeanus]